MNAAGTYLPRDLPNPPIYSKINPADSPILTLALSPAFATDNTLYAGTEQAGLYRSTDRGASWQPLALPAACQITRSS